LTEIVNDDVSEGKSFGFEKPKTKTYLLSFRMDKEHNDLLQNLFTVLEIKPKKDTITNRMLMLIEIMERIVKENQTLTDAAKSLKDANKDANKKIENLEKEIEELKKKSVKVHTPGIPGEIVKQAEEGNIFKETNIVKTVDSGQGEIVKPFYTRANLEEEILFKGKAENPMYKCLRGLQTDRLDNWLIACEVCETQALNTFKKCNSSMKANYIKQRSKQE
jgi:hypothetical protein